MRRKQFKVLDVKVSLESKNGTLKKEKRTAGETSTALYWRNFLVSWAGGRTTLTP